MNLFVTKVFKIHSYVCKWNGSSVAKENGRIDLKSLWFVIGNDKLVNHLCTWFDEWPILIHRYVNIWRYDPANFLCPLSKGDSNTLVTKLFITCMFLLEYHIISNLCANVWHLIYYKPFYWVWKGLKVIFFLKKSSIVKTLQRYLCRV